MALIARSAASLRIFGDDLDPTAITALLGGAPTRSQVRGDLLPGRKPRLAPFGSWIRAAQCFEPADFNSQIREILEPLNACPSTWATLHQHYRCDIFCGAFMNDWNEGFEIEPAVLALMAARGLKLGFDVYAD